MKLAQLVKRVREKLNMTQEDLAKELGKSVATISLWESGKRTLPPKAFYWFVERDGQVIFYETVCPTCGGEGVITATKL